MHLNRFSANTMSSALEVLGMSLPYSSSIPAVFPGKPSEVSSGYKPSYAHRQGKRMLDCREVHEETPRA
jgi:dihydroxyacid dehydratase/phosphogluconate dehydratase